ncbi:unnamed protein product [Diabrotica balteata]|uniref:Odorant receptor n=1 Tax=Diabrotica balteata TaxID=107213 RepID=A0A9N9TC48_DIABA|nr:unnamed protein product [Diabrotica balteata]
MATHEQDIKTFTISACLTGTFSMALLKSHFINKELHLLEKIRVRETRIYASKDEEIIQIYKNRANNINKFNLCYMIINYLDSVGYMYIIGPIFAPVETVYDSVKNTTHIHKQLPIESWMPFNVDEHFFKALLLEEFLSTFCMVLSFGSDIFFYGYIGYMIGQLEILNYILLNFETYKERIKQQLNCDDEKANYVTVQLCIKEHQIVMGYIDDYNNSMRTMMLLDFLHSSAQLAMISIIILLCVTDNLIKIAGLGFAVILLCRLGVFYWLANDVIVKILKTAYSYLTFVYKYKDEILG